LSGHIFIYISVSYKDYFVKFFLPLISLAFVFFVDSEPPLNSVAFDINLPYDIFMTFSPLPGKITLRQL